MKVQISVRASKLENAAGAFKGTSDPFAVITWLGQSREDSPVIIGKTEVIKNTLDPDWTTTFKVDYELGNSVNLLVKIFDKVSDGDNIPMGSGVFEVGRILGAKGNTKAKKMRDDKGTIFVKVQKAMPSETLALKISGSELTNLDGWFNKSDPFFEIRKKDLGLRGEEWNVVHRSSPIKNDLNPDWPEVEIDLGLLCGDNLDECLFVRIFDNESSGNHELMGSFETSVKGLISAMEDSSGFDIVKDGEKTGSIVVHVAEVSGSIQEEDAAPAEQTDEAPAPYEPPKKPTFSDYVAGGCEINLSVAIDFTGSNGDPREPGTLHYRFEDGQKNSYEKAISAIGGILESFDSDRKYPVVGFGAKYDGTVRHCFQCGSNEEVDGVQGIIDAYRETFASGLIMSSPTVVTDVIQMAASRAMRSQAEAFEEGKQKYSVLLILTDGAVSDIEATARCLNAVDQAPLSIVIVGIGDEDFESMQFLDDNLDGGIDNTQFVKFSSHEDNSASLTRATLKEIPSQMENFFLKYGIMPLPPVEIEEEDIVIEPSCEEEIDLTIEFGSDGNAIGASGNENGKVFVPGAY